MHSECTLSNVSNVSRSSDAKLRTDKAEKARTGTVAMAMATMVLKKRTRKNKLFHELFRIQNVSTKVWTKVSKGFQIIEMTSDEGSSFKMFQLHWSLRSRISRSPQRYTKYLRLYWQKPLRILRFL